MDRHRISESQRQFLLDGVQQGLRGWALSESESFGCEPELPETFIGYRLDGLLDKGAIDSDHDRDGGSLFVVEMEPPPKSHNLERFIAVNTVGGASMLPRSVLDAFIYGQKDRL